MNCPRCGGKAWLIGLPNHIYSAAVYRCYNLSAHGGEWCFSSESEDALAEASASRSLSASNAQQFQEQLDQTTERTK